jgi:ribonuclease HII
MLSAAQRERLVDEIVAHTAVRVGAASVAEIERINVRNAELLAVRRALRRLGPYDHVLIDGRPHKNIDFGPYTAIVDGDATSYSIACASIVAKVARDRLMRNLARRHPAYGWEHNVGYSTRQHLDAIEQLGPTVYHRRTYAPVRAVLADDLVQAMLPDPDCADAGQVA